MLCSVGIDLVSASEVRESLDTHGERYRMRIYTEHELRQCGDDELALAACFAAKEAAMKALGRDDEELPWREVALTSRDDGGLALKLTGAAADLAKQRGVAELSVSVSRARAHASAVVLARLER
ncbi:MAG: 4'-phosphopantetheinyl transferase superfamily protein [Solirubrobacterales bacterium]|nr:4'-phosphopantetheinyl transferase superfamily protein [Solirubrobacterales bacterium]